MESSTSMNDIPPLVDSDFEYWTECLGDYVSVWLQNSAEFIEAQRQKLLQMALCPFLYGVTHNLPEAWTEILYSYGVIEKERLHKTTPLSESELDILEMAEMIFARCSQLVGNKNDLKTILNFIYDVEERSALGGHIDMNYALQEVANLEVFSSMWAPMKRLYERRRKQAHVCIIYYFKLISHHIILYGRDGADNSDLVKKNISDVNRADRRGSGEGNKAFNDKDFKLAVEQYSSAIEKDPLNSLLYSNRAQAYLSVCHYRSALCDSKRAIILDPKNSKHYFRAAKSYLELGQLEKAEEANRQSLECCSDPLQKEAVQQQSQEIKVKSRMTKARQTVVGSGSEERELESSLIEYQRFVSEGSNFYLSNFYNRAVEQFKNAIDLSLRLGDKGLIVEESDLMVLWYVYGISCVKTVNLYNLQTAVEKFSSIISRTDTFPAAYYGLGLAYASLKRYKDAEAVLRMGLEKIDKHDVSQEYMWPQTGRIIEETNISTLKTLMIDLLKECMHPPKPDAMCKFHTSGDKSKKEIYLSDPDYKGHIRLECRENCAIEFHTTCWKPNESYSKGKHNWKEMLDNPCPTPGCWGLVSVVYICRPYPEKSLKMVSQMLPQSKTGPLRPKLKMKSESAFKLQRKLEKKMQRKERRQEVLSRLQEQTNVEEQPQNKPAKVSEPDLAQEVVSRNIDQSTVTVLHREEPEMPVEKKQKASKGKKKEKKQKQFITLELQFKGDENKERYGIHSLDDNGEFVIKPPAALNPGILPTPGSIASLTTDVTQQPNLDLTDNAVYDFIYNILASKGPMDLHGKELESHLRFLCEEAQTRILLRGGLLNFLGSSPRFNIYSNNIVSIAFPVQQKKNPWEGKSSFVRSGDPQSVWPRQGYGLNPGAKEFVPQEPSLVPEVEDKLDSYTFFPKPAFGDLPKPAEDVDDGFTTVVNKKHSRTRSMQPLIQPEPLRHPVKPSFYNSVDEITLDAPIFSAGRCASVDSVDDADKEEVREGKSEPVLPARRMSSPFIPWDDPVEKLPTVSPAAAVGKTAFSPHMMAHTGQGSDASDLSGDDLQRVASPALSSNSGSTSSRAEGSQVSSQRSSQPAPLRPLKAPSIMLPSRGKTKKTAGHLSSRLHQLTLAADGSVMYDGYDEESVSSTASDRDSSCGDPRPHSERFIQTPPTMTLDQDIISAGKLGQGLTTTGSHPGSEKYIDLLKVRKGSTSSLDTILSEKTGINAGNPPQKEIWAQKHNEEHLIKNLRFKIEMKEHPKGDCFRDEIDKIANSEDLSSVVSPPQPPIQRPQSRTQTLTQVGSKSENKKPFDAHKFPSNTWGYFNPGEQYEMTNKVSVPLSESWGQDQGGDFPATDFNQDFKGDGVIDSEQANSSSGQSKHNLSTSFQFIPSSEDFGSLESETVPRINPWSSGLDKEYIGSIHSSHRDVTFESDNSLFAPWMNFSDSSSSSSTRPSTYTSSTHATGSRTNQSFISSVPAGGGISSLIKSSRDFSLEDMPFGHKNLVVNRTSQEKRFNMFSAGAEYKTVQTQTALSGAEVEEVLEKLNAVKEAQALQEATQQKNYELQHALKNCQDQLNQENMLNGKLRSDLKKLNLKVQIAEISAEKWKEDVDQMVKNIEDLKTLNQSHIDRSNELSKQLEAERVKFRNLQTELLKQKKMFALQKLDLGKQEAHQQLQKMSAVISQGSIVGKSLLDAAQEKHMELSSYISQCEALKKHIEVNAQRLREDLESGASTDMSSIEVSPPALPMPLMQANDLPEVASGYGPGSVFKNGLQFPSIHGSDSVIKVMSVPKATSQPLETEDEDAKAYLSMVYGYGDRIDPAHRSKNGSVAAASDSNTSSKVGSEDSVDDERKWDSFYTASQKPSSDTSRLGTSSQVRPHSPAPLAAPSGGVWRGATRTSGLPNLRTPSLQTETTRTASPLNVESQFPHPRIHVPQQVQENVQQLPLPQQQPYFERVVERVQESFPSYSRYEIQKMADELIKDNSGPLEGWTYETLASKIFDMILDLEETKDLTNAYGIMAADLHLANSATEKKKTFDLQCSICQSELEPEDTLTLSCGHRFHSWCIQHWLQSDRSCPNCRSHALLAEDFPSLM